VASMAQAAEQLVALELFCSSPVSKQKAEGEKGGVVDQRSFLLRNP